MAPPLHDLWFGFGVALQGANPIWCCVGLLAGGLIGRLPGLGALSAASILLPLACAMHPVPALLLIGGILWGARHGGPGPGVRRFAHLLAASAAILALGFAAPSLATMAFSFGPTETFSIVLLGLLMGATLSRAPPLKGMAMTLFGLLCRMVGTDPNSGVVRFSFGMPELGDGIELAAVAMGLFALAGFLLDANRMPADGAPARRPGVSGAAATALLLGALTGQGITPGPQLVADHPDVFWGAVAGVWMGSLLPIVLNLPTIGTRSNRLRVPRRLVVPTAVFFIVVGMFTTQNSLFQIGEMLAFGIAGALLVALDFPVAPILLGFVLGPMMEENFLRAMLLSRGDPAIFVQRPISGAFVVLSVLLLGAVAWSRRRGRGAAPRLPATQQVPHGWVADAADR